ncbi:MAG: alpha/beta hydrolase, partial [Actinobacteria bacterium]|nr:alpha/beta hydrolase [Actinomycetota bacterium]
VTDETDPFSVDPALDMYNPDNGWRPWPEPASYDRGWLAGYRDAQRERVARVDGIARRALAERDEYATKAAGADRGSAEWNQLRRRAVHTRYITTYRTLADPAYLDATIDPDDRAHGTIFAFPDPLDANYGLGGLGRVMTARGWLSTWSGLSSHAAVAETIPGVSVPTLVVHPTADTEIRMHQAQAIYDAGGAADKTYVELKGAAHYLQGRRREAMDLVVDWLRPRCG